MNTDVAEGRHFLIIKGNDVLEVLCSLQTLRCHLPIAFLRGIGIGVTNEAPSKARFRRDS